MIQNLSESENLIKNLSFCVIDLETTGGDHSKDKIIEIGLVKIENLKICKELTYLINPEIKIPEFIQNLTSISENSLIHEKKIEEVISFIVDFIGDSIIVAHNAAFDVPFLNSVLERVNRPALKNPTLCTNLMTKYLIPEIMSSNLPYLAKLFEIQHKKAHRALEDAVVTSQILLIYLNFFIKKGIKKVNHLYYPRKKFELDIDHLKKESSPEFILDKIKQIEIPFTLTFKGEKGIIHNLIPVTNGKEEIDFISEALKEDYISVTIKLTGTWYKGLIDLNHYFSRIPSEKQDRIIDYINHKYKYTEKSEADFEKNFQDLFIIRTHLIPEQFAIHKIDSCQSQTELIFRYPIHQKRLAQFINFHLKNQSKKNQLTSIHPKLKNIFSNFYLNIENYPHNYFIFSGLSFKKNSSQMKNDLMLFINRKRESTNFPRNHL